MTRCKSALSVAAIIPTAPHKWERCFHKFNILMPSFPKQPPPPRSGQLKRDFNWSIRCVRKILQQEMWRTNIGWTFGELWQISESYYLSKVKCVKTISIHNLQNYGWFSIKFKGAILWKSSRAGSRKDKEKIWTDAVIDAVVVTLSNFRSNPELL